MAPYLSEHLPENGFASHVVRTAFLSVGIDVEYVFFPWKRAYSLAKKGVCQGSVLWVHTQERARNFYYSDPVVIDNEFLFHLKKIP